MKGILSGPKNNGTTGIFELQSAMSERWGVVAGLNRSVLVFDAVACDHKT
jgi:hypothetical protein